MSSSSSTNGKRPPDAAAASGPTFLDNVCLHLASSLLGATTVTDHLTTSMTSTHAATAGVCPQQLYWRSPILSPLSVLRSPISPVVSQEAQSRVVYVDLTISFLPPPNTSNAATKRPRVRAKFGALLRHWHPIRLDAGTGVIDRTCRPDGGTYIQQGRYLSKRGLREYGESINIDLDSMESRPTARLLGKALGGTGLRAEVANGNDRGGGSPRVVVTIDHHSLGETGSFAIVDDNDEDTGNGGKIGEKAMAMLLANIEADSRRKSITAATSSAGNSSPSAVISGVDPEEENEMRKVFEQWWDMLTKGPSTSKEISSASDLSTPIGKTNQSSPAMAAKGMAGILKTPHDTGAAKASAIGIGIDKESESANMEQKSPISIAAKAQPIKLNDAALVGANGVKENVTNDSSKRATSTSGAAAQDGDNPSSAAVADATEATALSSPVQVQKKKRKTPGPILVRAGGGVGGGRKKKRGKITIGKAS